MKWSFLLFLPALVSVLWATATLLLRRKLNRAQVLLSLTLILEAFAMTVMFVFFRGKAGGLFIYDFLFQSVALLIIPMYYMGICSLCEPRGVTLKQRRSFFVPLLYILILTVGAFNLGPRRYEIMCHAIGNQSARFIAGDMAWNFMLTVSQIVFPLLLFFFSILIMASANRKFRVFINRYNTFYSDRMHKPRVKSVMLNVTSLAFFLLGFAQVLLITYRPYYYKYWLIACAVLVTVIQFFFGRQVYRMRYDARYLAKIE